MPEGPSIVILAESVAPFVGKKVLDTSGNSKEDIQRAKGHKLIEIRTWGKQLLLCFSGFTIKVHLLLFGSYRINEEKDTPPRLRLDFSSGFINFYACSVKIIEGDIDALYDWDVDIMSDTWNQNKAIENLIRQPDRLVCDVLLDQEIFSGSGNIIKNEVLYRTCIHPLSLVKFLPHNMLIRLVKEVRDYAFDFLKWKKEYSLKKHWLAHTNRICTRCNLPLNKEYLGKTKRRTFYCNNCQILYDS
ncbi:MAG TPA: DNA-formamidopyrimidine glycosylase family protein [Flavipsychrobacter sp.]|nr:DNA-formamidopyrimidine glycosylase family protein [Flavipsychrobacter sp.]